MSVPEIERTCSCCGLLFGVTYAQSKRTYAPVNRCEPCRMRCPKTGVRKCRVRQWEVIR